MTPLDYFLVVLFISTGTMLTLGVGFAIGRVAKLLRKEAHE